MTVKQGDRIEITGTMPEEPNPLPVGSLGTVRRVRNPGTELEQISVDWDDASRCLLLLPDDPFRIVSERDD